MDKPKEAFYDKRISPLMKRVIALCKKANINMAATFALDPKEDGDLLFCTTCLPLDKGDQEGYEKVEEIGRLMSPSRPSFMAITIHNG